MDFDLLINKKKNAEAYKEQIINLKSELSEIESKSKMTKFPEEKKQLEEEIVKKNEEIEECQKKYDIKKEFIVADIEKAKSEVEGIYQRIEEKKISKDEYKELLDKKKENEEELKECLDKKIPELEEKMNSLISEAKNMGYDFDITSLAKELEGQVAYKKYLEEENSEIDEKIKNVIVIEDNMEELKYITYLKMRLINLNYDNLENWYEKEMQDERFLKTLQPEKPTKPEKLAQSEQQEKLEEPTKTEAQIKSKQSIQPKVQKQQIQPNEPVQKQPVQIKPKQPIQPKIPTPKQPAQSTQQTKPTPSTVIYSGRKKELIKVSINPKNGKIIYYEKENNGVIKKCEKNIDYSKQYFSNKEIQDIIKQSKKDLKLNLNTLYKKIDPNILEIIKDNKSLVNKYVKSIYGKTLLPFDVEYNLHGINKSALSIKEIHNVNKIARRANKIDNATVKKDSFIERVKGTISKGTNKLLQENNPRHFVSKKINKVAMQTDRIGTKIRGYFKGKNVVQRNIDDINVQRYYQEKLNNINIDTQSDREKFKQRLQAFKKNSKHYFSKKLDKSNLINNIKMNTKIAGRKITGYINGENPLKVKSDVIKIKDSYDKSR